ncbi:hypothetical protein [Vibrio sp. SCSIO 43169]|uniref:hypothetical protein n=1 Tax=Vibrio sp. SCSIO 43169 TaxID=2822801 RepID=UPI0020449ABF|nr:hypothetical protein [Vibrio sp. SCSIO 43169]MCM5507137.1 hypothetical protein [Vibrio sp. SCSIO 43169]
MKNVYYWPVIDLETKEVSSTRIKADYRGGVHHIPIDALKVEPKPAKEGYLVVAVFGGDNQPIDSKYIEDHRGTMIYDESNCTKSEMVSILGPIKDGFTPDMPQSEFDERINGAWVTNESNKYIVEYNQIDDKRRALYSQMCDPLKMEAMDLMDEGKEAEALQLKQQSLAAKQKIKTENPWPTPPEN